jgi:hypothetical protein
MQIVIEVKEHLQHHIQNDPRQLTKLKTFGKWVTITTNGFHINEVGCSKLNYLLSVSGKNTEFSSRQVCSNRKQKKGSS